MNERYITNLELSNKCKSKFIEVRNHDELKKVEFKNYYIAKVPVYHIAMQALVKILRQ